MSDIIKDAAWLLDGATPAPWEVRTYDTGGAIYGIGNIEPGYGGGDPLDCVNEDAYLAAAAPELAQALAEETWEYSAQYKNDYTNGWKFLEELQGRWCTRETLTLWVEGNLHRFYDNIRIVRRRVSPPEVCE